MQEDSTRVMRKVHRTSLAQRRYDPGAFLLVRIRAQAYQRRNVSVDEYGIVIRHNYKAEKPIFAIEFRSSSFGEPDGTERGTPETKLLPRYSPPHYPATGNRHDGRWTIAVR
jgi:hypothetical protein